MTPRTKLIAIELLLPQQRHLAIEFSFSGTSGPISSVKTLLISELKVSFINFKIKAVS